MDNQSSNPLSKHFRQPAIYLELPSKGKYWVEDGLILPLNNELPVYPLTAKDEITLRTPDALLNGNGVVDVIHSCVPNIKNAWSMPSIDVDAVLIAIRIASYGHLMDFDSTCPHCKHENTFELDLRDFLSSLKSPNFEDLFKTNEVEIKFQPQPYFLVSKINVSTFTQNKLIAAIDALEDGDLKNSKLSEHMNTLIDLNYDSLTNSTELIVCDGITVTDKSHIKEFYQNIDSKALSKVQSHLEQLIDNSSIKPKEATCQECQKLYQLNFVFDYSSFFAVGF